MITLETITSEIINVSEEDRLSANLIAVAVKLDDAGNAHHSGLLIGVDGEYSLFHYTSKEVLIEDPAPTDQWYFCKELEILNGEEYALDFLAFCEMILEDEAPNYGTWFDSSLYDENGRYFTEGEAKNFTTCVGFCIKVISGFIQTKGKYFELSDWDISTVDEFRDHYPEFYTKFYNNFIKHHPQITEEDFKRYWKRITPSEYTASAFLKNIPIRRSDIQPLLANVDQVLRAKRLAI